MLPDTERGRPIWRCQACTRREMRSLDPRCDFCSATPVVANEIAEDFLVNPGPIGISTGSWGACQECHDLVQRKDWLGLEERGIEAMQQKFPNAPRKEVRLSVQAIQRQFRVHAG